MLGMFLSVLWSTTGTSKLTHNHEVHCNMIIFMLCYCVVDYSNIQKFEGKPLRWDQPPNIRSPVQSFFGVFSVVLLLDPYL